MKHLSFATLTAAALLSAAFSVEAKTIVVTTTNNDAPPAGTTSLKQAISALADGDIIQFNITGPGPHIIVTPLNGYPLITANNVTIDGYSQPGSKPNSNGILGGNNAVIQIVLDSTLDDSGPSLDPTNEALLQRRSTRLPYSGYGDSENAILGVLGGDNFKIRGIAFIGRHTPGSDEDPSLYAIGLVQEAKNAKVQGCWFGITPGNAYTTENLKPVTDAVAAFRYRTGGDVYSGGLVIGTDGDGANDVQEFNVVLGCHIAFAIEAPDLRVAGNYVNVFPDGLTFVDVEAVHQMLLDTGRSSGDSSVEFFENGRLCDNTVVGTNGDGKSDGNERNIVAHPIYDHDVEFYSNNRNAVIAGNYFGVGVDGTTRQKPLTLRSPDLVSTSGTGDVRIGSNGDGTSDDLEGNLIYDVLGTLFVDAGSSIPITARRNKMVNNNFTAFPFGDGENGRVYATYYANAILDPATQVAPTIDDVTDGIMTGTVPEPNTANYPKHVVDVYMVDPVAEALALTHPGTWVGSFVEGSAVDKEPAANKFKIDLRGMPIIPGKTIALAVTYTKATTGTPGTNSVTGPLSASAVANMPVIVPGSVESLGLTRLVPDKSIIVPQNDALGNWEPYASVLGTSTFLIEGNTFADGYDTPDTASAKQRFVVALQPAAGAAGRMVEGFYADNGQPFNGPINASRQNGNPGRVAGDKRPGASVYMVGAEASPHTLAEFGSDNRWNLGFNRLGDGRYGTVQTYSLNTATLTPAMLMKAADSAYGRLTAGTPPGNQISRFGADLAALSNGNFVSVVEDRSRVIVTDSDCVVATIFGPDGSIVKDSFVVAKGDIWSNVAAYQGGFAVRCKPEDGSAGRLIHLFDNAGNRLTAIAQTTSGISFDTGRGDGTRIAGHINSPYIYLAGKATDAPMVKLAVWDTRDPQRVAVIDVSEPAFVGNNDRVNLAVDALDRAVVSWVSNPEGYEASQVAARVFALNGTTMSLSGLTPSFFPFINTAKSGGIRTFQMSVAVTTRQICIAAKGEINLQNKPEQGASINVNTGNYLKEINFYTVFSHPNPQDDTTPPPTGPTLNIARSGANVTLSWDAAATGFTLESKASLGAGPWIPIGTQNPATVPIGPGNTFYRLRK